MARSFNGTSNVITIGTPSVLDITGAITLSAWVNAASLPAAGNNFADFLEKGYDGTNQQYVLQFSGINIDTITNQQCARIFGFNGSSTSGASIPYSSTNVWSHIAGFFNGSNWSIFLNGSSSGQSQAGTAAPAHAAANVSLGAGYISGSAARFFNGNMADAAIWNVALSQGEISALATGARPYTIRNPSLVGYWPLDGLQSPEPDLSGNSNNGTLTGTALVPGPPTMIFTPRWPQTNFPSTPIPPIYDVIGWAEIVD